MEFFGISQKTPPGCQAIGIIKVHNKFHRATTSSLGFRTKNMLFLGKTAKKEENLKNLGKQ